MKNTVSTITYIVITLIGWLFISGCQTNKPSKKDVKFELGDTIAFEIERDSLDQYVEIISVNDTTVLLELHVENKNPHGSMSGNGLSCAICKHTYKYPQIKYSNSKGKEYTLNQYGKCIFPDVIDSTGFEILFQVEENNEFAILVSMVDPIKKEDELPFIYKIEMPLVKTRPKDDFDDE